MKGIVWGSNRFNCYEKLESLIADYKLYCNIKPKKIRQSRSEYKVVFENGDIWQATVASESACGLRCNISLVDRRISSAYMPIIENCTTAPPYHAINYYY